MSGLNGKVALVTGGTGGIGTAICIKLAQAGCKVVSTYMDEAQANEWKAKMAAAGFDMAIVKCDVSSFEDCKAMGDKLNADFGGVDVLVNNAGITKDGTFRKMSDSQWNAVMNVNLDSVFNVTKQFIDGMLNKGWGRVINISSVHEVKATGFCSVYGISKGAMQLLVRELALEYSRYGITVNNVAPGAIRTDINRGVLSDPAYEARVIGKIPVGFIGQPEDVAHLVAFLASEEARYLTGATLLIDGGLSL